MAAEARSRPRTATDELAFDQFKGPVAVVNRRLVVGLALQELLGNRSDRVAWYLVNRGAADISVAFDQEVDASNGILVTANGGFLSMSILEDGQPTGWALYGISGGAANAVYIAEFIRYAGRAAASPAPA